MKSPDEIIGEISELSSRLPEYARLIALFWVKEMSASLEARGSNIELDDLGKAYKRAIASGLQAGVGLTASEASSETEFFDFYIRHGILANMLGNALFSLMQLNDQRLIDQGMAIVNGSGPRDVRNVG